MKERSVLFVNALVMSIACLVLLPVSATADERAFTFQYTAKFVCGNNPAGATRVLPGAYATAINIHNPNNKPVVLRKKVALTFPPAVQQPGPVSDSIQDTLGPNQALEVDCGEIPAEFFPPDILAGFPPYTKSFLVIESNRSLNVTAVYTAGITAQVSSIDVEQIRERRIKGDKD